MALVIKNRLWELSEKLYIHCYKTSGFIDFLRSNGVNLPDDYYSNFEVYSFMSTEQNNFAQFMQRIPTYRYFPILEKIIFNENIKNTQRDNWNYYGTYIKKWYPELVNQIKQAGLVLDDLGQKISVQEIEQDFPGGNLDFLQYDFKDPFLDYLKKEINENYNDGHYVAVVILSRKLMECIVLRIYEIVFREKDENGIYNARHHGLWYDVSSGRTLNFDRLIDNLRDNSVSFYDAKDLMEDTCVLMKSFKKEANKVTHRDYKIPTQDNVEKLDIPGICSKLRRLYLRFCNP